jgi:hypothetical protein
VVQAAALVLEIQMLVVQAHQVKVLQVVRATLETTLAVAVAVQVQQEQVSQVQQLTPRAVRVHHHLSVEVRLLTLAVVVVGHLALAIQVQAVLAVVVQPIQLTQATAAMEQQIAAVVVAVQDLLEHAWAVQVVQEL